MAEVEKLYLEGSDRGLIAHWKFDNDLVDEINSVTITTADTTTYPDGIFNEGLNTDGNKFVITSSTLKNLVEGDTFTITFWIKLTEMDSTHSMGIIARYDAGGNPRGGFNISLLTSGKLRFERLYDSNSWSVNLTDNYLFGDNLHKWVHCSVICYATGSKIYIDEFIISRLRFLLHFFVYVLLYLLLHSFVASFVCRLV